MEKILEVSPLALNYTDGRFLGFFGVRREGSHLTLFHDVSTLLRKAIRAWGGFCYVSYHQGEKSSAC
jgi:hypothetical protein